MDFIYDGIKNLYRENQQELPVLNSLTLADLFAGSGSVGEFFKEKGFNVIANDLQYYSYVTNYHLLKNNPDNCKLHLIYFYLKNIDLLHITSEFSYLSIGKYLQDIYLLEKNNLIYFQQTISNFNYEEVFDLLNNHFSKMVKNNFKGFISNNYAPNGIDNKEYNRSYFTEENANLIDSARFFIDFLKQEDLINENEYFFLLSSLIDSADKIPNTTGVYGAYLKDFKGSALKKFELKPTPFVMGNKENKIFEVYNENAVDLVKKIQGDILYLDPPYNTRQYCDYYHLLETLAKNDNPEIKGKTGNRADNSQKSKFSVKKEALNQLEELIKNANFKYILLSYNNEGIISLEDLEKVFNKYGKYIKYEKKYRRYKSSNIENQESYVIEYLHCLIKQ